MTAAELNTSRAKCYALALLRIAELERKARHVTTTCPHCKTQYEHTLPSNAPESDKALTSAEIDRLARDGKEIDPVKLKAYHERILNFDDHDPALGEDWPAKGSK